VTARRGGRSRRRSSAGQAQSYDGRRSPWWSVPDPDRPRGGVGNHDPDRGPGNRRLDHRAPPVDARHPSRLSPPETPEITSNPKPLPTQGVTL